MVDELHQHRRLRHADDPEAKKKRLKQAPDWCVEENIQRETDEETDHEAALVDRYIPFEGRHLDGGHLGIDLKAYKIMGYLLKAATGHVESK
ncbi:hypothetical protein IFM46972_09388 [Aspergillus udagawae]|uniref:Uncharacterized protein n=1 Tax=Aspergillus udagawae TaxID=91492 RepID=A0A8H3S6B9_9EURO|nr:hypothetical protein IFM46972_09388 [Aspergillus udagawae]